MASVESSTVVPVFADLYKPIRDSLTKSYLPEGQKVDVTIKDTVKINPIFVRDPSGVVSSSVTLENDLYPCPYARSVLKYGINDKGLLNAKVTVDSMPHFKGLKFDVISALLVGSDISKALYDLNFELKQEHTTVTGSVSQSLVAELAAVCCHKDLNLGGRILCNLANQAVLGHQIAGSLRLNKCSTIAAVLENLMNLKIGFSTCNGGWNWAGEYTCNVSNGTNQEITLGATTNLKDGQIVKAKMNTKGILNAALVHILSPELVLTTSIEIDTAKGYTSKWGTSLVFEK